MNSCDCLCHERQLSAVCKAVVFAEDFQDIIMGVSEACCFGWFGRERLPLNIYRKEDDFSAVGKIFSLKQAVKGKG